LECFILEANFQAETVDAIAGPLHCIDMVCFTQAIGKQGI